MTDFSFRPVRSNTAVITMLGVLIVVVAAGFIYVPMALRAQTQSSSSMKSPASGSEQTQTSSVRISGTQAEIDTCINAATEAHNQLWAATCRQVSATMQIAYDACISNGKSQSYCQAQFGAYLSMGPTCTLPLIRQNELNVKYNAAKIVCQQKTY
ncbi:MAG: hypothetical protein WCS85_02110 [Candidatus Peribacteraceae bacterium]